MVESLRIHFAWSKEGIKIISVKKIEMKSYPSDSLHFSKNQSGTWFELTDDQKTLYRKIIQDPFTRDEEIFSEKKDESITRKRVEVNKGEFIALVPFLKTAKKLVLYGNLDVDSQESSKLIQTFDLREYKKE